MQEVVEIVSDSSWISLFLNLARGFCCAVITIDLNPDIRSFLSLSSCKNNANHFFLFSLFLFFECNVFVVWVFPTFLKSYINLIFFGFFVKFLHMIINFPCCACRS